MLFSRPSPQPSPGSSQDIRRFLIDTQVYLQYARQCFASQRADESPNRQLDAALDEVRQLMQRLTPPLM